MQNISSRKVDETVSGSLVIEPEELGESGTITIVSPKNSLESKSGQWIVISTGTVREEDKALVNTGFQLESKNL